jgi:hypothetical protein
MLVSGHPTDPNFNPRPYDFFSFFKKKKKKASKHGKEIKTKNLQPKYHDGNGYFP